MLATPIQLPLLAVTNVLSTLIGVRHIRPSREKTGVMTSISEAMAFDPIEYGAGAVFTTVLKGQPQNDWAKGKNPFEVNEPFVAEETFVATDRKVIPLTTFPTIMPQAGTNSGMINELMGVISSEIENTKNIMFYSKEIANLAKWTPRAVVSTDAPNVISKQLVTVAQTSTGVLQENLVDAMTIAKAIRNTIIDMERPSGNYLDIDTYTVGTNTYTDLEVMTSRQDMQLYISSKYQTNLIIDAYSTLYGGENLRNIIGEVIEIAEADAPNTNFIARICKTKKFFNSPQIAVVQANNNSADMGTYAHGHFWNAIDFTKLWTCCELQTA